MFTLFSQVCCVLRVLWVVCVAPGLALAVQVFSVYRVVQRAAKDGKPIALLNAGPTRADGLAALRAEGAPLTDADVSDLP